MSEQQKQVVTLESLIELREHTIEEGLNNKWVWPAHDKKAHDGGAWQGPIENWRDAHRTQYFEHMKNYDVVVTAGANCGLHTRVYASKFKTVYAFEPDWLNFYCLAQNCPEPNVIKLMMALGSQNKPIFLQNNYPNAGMYHVVENTEGNIPCITLDSLNLHACDFIQLDVEGFEAHVIYGARQTIEKFRPVIALETMTMQITDYLTSIGYQLNKKSKHDKIWIPS